MIARIKDYHLLTCLLFIINIQFLSNQMLN